MIVVFRFRLIGDGGEFAAREGQSFAVDRDGADIGHFIKVERDGGGERAVGAEDEVVAAGGAVVLVQAEADVVEVVGVVDDDVEVAPGRVVEGGLAADEGGNIERHGHFVRYDEEDGGVPVFAVAVIDEELRARPVDGGFDGSGRVFRGDVVGCALFRADGKTETVGLVVGTDDGGHIVGHAVACRTEGFVGEEFVHEKSPFRG